MVYQWREGARIQADAQAVGEAIADLEERKGGMATATDLVKAAEPKESPLHACFEWNDTKAAHKYREEQARYVFRSLVVVDAEAQRDRSVRAFVVVERDGEAGYVSTVRAMSDAEMRRQVLERAFRELKSWQRRYQDYRELAALFSTADQLEADLFPVAA